MLDRTGCGFLDQKRTGRGFISESKKKTKFRNQGYKF